MATILKTIVIFEIIPLELAKYRFLGKTVNFGLRSAFSKGPGSAFSEGYGMGQGPLFKQNLNFDFSQFLEQSRWVLNYFLITKIIAES